MKAIVDAPGFSEGAKVVVEQIDDNDWRVREPFSYVGQRGEKFEVRVGQTTDFASVPRVFVWFLPRYGAYTLAAILHDHLWRDLARREKMPYLEADGLFRRAMRELGVPFLRRWIMWAAVRWGALLKHGGTRGWWREAPRVLLITVLALPILMPPAILVAVALGIFTLIELLLFVPLKTGQVVKERALMRPGKKVNPPSIDWRS